MYIGIDDSIEAITGISTMKYHLDGASLISLAENENFIFLKEQQ